MNKKGFTFEERKTRRGFTLVEILVVMSIIGILMGLTLTASASSRKTARDGKRKTDLEQIRSALEMYRADHPVIGYPGGLGDLSGYISVPSDPLPDRLYPYSRSGNTYTLCAALETGTVTSSCPGTCGSCGTGVTCTYKVCNP